MADVSESVSASTLYPELITYTDNVSAFILNEVGIENATDSVSTITRVDSKPISTETGEIITTEDDLVIYTEGV